MKTLKSIIAAVLLSLPFSVPESKADFKLGADAFLGGGQNNISIPSEYRNVSITGNTGYYDVPMIRTYNLQVPSSKKTTEWNLGAQVFVANETENTWKNFRLGKEFYFNFLGNSDFLATDGGNEWPNAAVSLDATTENIFFLEKQVFSVLDKENDGLYVSLVGRLNKHKWKMETSTYRVPYGDEWYQSLNQVRTSNNEIAKGSGESSGYLGLKLGQCSSIGESFIEVGAGIPIDDVVKPSWSARFGYGIRF